jgi:phage gp36-like protein
MADGIKKITLGDAFKLTFINSGATASPIELHIFNNSETLVGSWTGIDSGNGHYYVLPTVINSPGVYRARWFATIDTNTYSPVTWLEAWADEADEAGRYIAWSDVIGRWREYSTIAPVKAAGGDITYAEAEIDARLSTHFTTPFSNNNLTIRDIVIDMAYLKAARLTGKDRKEISEWVDKRITSLKTGDMSLILDDGTVLSSYDAADGVYSTTKDYHPVFGMGDEANLSVSSMRLEDEEDARG